MAITIHPGTDHRSVILHDGDTLGYIQGDTAHLTAKPSNPLKGAIRKASGNLALKFEISSAALGDSTGEKEGGGVLDDAPPPSAPPEPPRTPGAGDKTPEVIAWRRKYWSAAKFQACYGHRNIGDL